MKNKKIIFILICLVVLAVGVFLIIKLTGKEGTNNNDNNNKPNINDNDKNQDDKNDGSINLSTVELGQEYQVICTNEPTIGLYATSTRQEVDTFYSDGTCRYEFTITDVYNDINTYNEAKERIKNGKHSDDECLDDYTFDDNTMTIKLINGMGHCHKDMGEDLCEGVKLNSTDELKEKIKPLLELNQSDDEASCKLYKK